MITREGARVSLISGIALAQELGVGQGTVSNWVTRGALPDSLAPLWVQGKTGPWPVWPLELVPAFRAWRREEAARKGRP